MTPSGASHDDDWPFVRTLLTCADLDSTSDRAAGLIREEGIELPMAVWAMRQTRGRGRGSHSWWSDAGSLTFTLAIDPMAHRLTVESEPKLALATAVAVIDALEELGFGSPSLGIRWPNDLEVGGRKFGGILPERIEAEGGHRVLIGVGLNVWTRFDGAPADIRSMATSLAAIQERSFDESILPRMLSVILRHFEGVLIRVVGDDPWLASRWNQLDLLRDRWVKVDLGARIVAGRGCGIDPDGAFCLGDGRERLRLFGGQVLRS
jgi:BirA family transcriptional regulator, biotin operon repressor / biotin---[acetyl-CoA-carboxylase] ligase